MPSTRLLEFAVSPSNRYRLVKDLSFTDPPVFLQSALGSCQIEGLRRPAVAAISDEGFAVIADWLAPDVAEGSLYFIRPDGTALCCHYFSVNLGRMTMEPGGSLVFISTASAEHHSGFLVCYEVQTGRLLWRRYSPQPSAEIVADPAQCCILVGKPFKMSASDYIIKMSYAGRKLERWPRSGYEAITFGELARQDQKRDLAERMFAIGAGAEISPYFRARALRNLGELAAEEGRRSDTLNYYERALDLNPKVGLVLKVRKLRRELE